MFSQTVEYALRGCHPSGRSLSCPSNHGSDCNGHLSPQALFIESDSRIMLCQYLAVEAWRRRWDRISEVAVQFNHSGCRKCCGTNCPDSTMSAWPNDPRTTPLPAAQAHGQHLGDD